MPNKPGWKSTEFWMSLAGMAAGFYLILKGQAEYGMGLIAVANGGYAVSRGLAKKVT